MIFYSAPKQCQTHIYKLLYSYRAVITWVYIVFVNRGLNFYGVNIDGYQPPQEILEIWSALGAILDLRRVSS